MDRLGRDTTHREGGRVIVQSPVSMPDWKVSKFRRTAVVYKDERFFVAEVTRGADGGHRYVLEPWPADRGDRPSRTILYEEEYVHLRDRNRWRAWIALCSWPALVCANPLLGCLWLPTKRSLQRRLGLDPKFATLQALLCQYVLVLLLVLAMFAAMWGYVILPGLSWAEVLIVAGVLLLDAVMRYDHLQKYPEEFLGVGEWLGRFRR